MEILNRQVLPGTHIWVPRRFGLTNLYQHHGIYIGHRQVVHFTEATGPWSGGVMKKEPIKQFIDGAAEIGIKEWCSPPFDRRRCKQTALEFLEDPMGFEPGSYRLHMNNCETFATVCATGLRESEQVKLATRRILHFAIGPLPGIISCFVD